MNIDVFQSKTDADTQKVFQFFSSNIFFYFRIFSYDLEISESFKNATPNVLIRLQNARLKKVFLFLEISSDPPGYRKWVGEVRADPQILESQPRENRVAAIGDLTI